MKVQVEAVVDSSAGPGSLGWFAQRWAGHRAVALVAALGLALAPWAGVHAQEEEDDDDADAAEVQQADTRAEVEEVVVTGSRLKRDTFSSISPLQIITAEVKREAGLVDAGEILQESTASSGIQIDLTFSGFVLDEGPGVVPANLRGLGSGRTLVLVNDRRIGATGVEGAPQAADLGVLPGSLVQTYDLLLDGASSIYGSDAVGGVANVTLKKDFDGFEVNVFGGRPHHPKGDENVLAMSWGRNFDRGFIGVGVEYKFNEAVPRSARPWTNQCERHVEIDEAGKIRHQDLFYPTVFGMRWDQCRVGLLAGRVSVPFDRVIGGSVYFAPRHPGAYWGGFAESNAWGFGVDADGDGETDISFREHSLNGRRLFRHIFGQRKTVSGMVYGEYTLEGEMNLTPYFEVLHFQRDFFVDNGAYQLWPQVPAGNPYNICNPEGEGVDCQLAMNQLYTNPFFIAKFKENFGGFCASIGIRLAGCEPAAFGYVRPPIGPVSTLPITVVRGDRTLNWTHTDFVRVVGGIRGDLPMINFGSLSGWSFDVSLTYNISESTSIRPGVRWDRLALSQGWYSQDHVPCVNDIDDATRAARGAQAGRGLPALQADVQPGCLPVNMFAPSLYAGVVGDFATQAERDYVFDNRDFDTEVGMTLLSAYVTGTVFDMPAGSVPAGFGFEYRRDEIDSIPDAVARDGLFFGYFADGGAVGSRDVWEVFGEIELPLVGGKLAAREVDLNLSARWTADEFYGGAGTGSAKLGWRPIDSLLMRFTWGTSYRAPNLRELFLAGQTGFLPVFDPCLIPEEAFGDLTTGDGDYDPALDPRDQIVLDNCRRDGVDPTVAHNNGNNSYSVEVKAGGSLDLNEETSESVSFGFSWEQPFTNAFDLALGLTYYKIEIDNTIVEPSLGYIIYDCYYSETGGTFCPRIMREPVPERPLIDIVDRGFINRDNETVRGVDANLTFGKTFEIFDRPFDVSLDITANRLIEHFDVFLNDTGERDQNEYHRQWFYPERTAIADLRIGYRDWYARWQTVYTSKVDQHPLAKDSFSHINAPSGRSDTCLGPPDDLLCRDYRTAGDHKIHRLSVGYRATTWNMLFGVRNVFDTPPPLVDSNETSYQVNNAANGYELGGRTYFLGFDYSFGGGE